MHHLRGWGTRRDKCHCGFVRRESRCFHLVGTPNLPMQESRALVHHTLGNGEFDLFSGVAAAVVCATAIMTPQNAASETERLIAAALYHRRPVYMAIPSDVADMPVLAVAPAASAPTSDPEALTAATEAVVTALTNAGQTCVLPGVLLR